MRTSPPSPAGRPIAPAPARRVVLSLGGGVQSTTLALLAFRGELPLPEAAVFADTGWEPPAVYDNLAWLREQLADQLPLHVVRKHHASGESANIRADTLAVVRAERLRVATMPVFVRETRQANPSLLQAARRGRPATIEKRHPGN